MLTILDPSGHLKTSIARLYGLWLKEKWKQETSFQSVENMASIQRKLRELYGLNFLVDDLHQVFNKSSFAEWFAKIL